MKTIKIRKFWYLGHGMRRDKYVLLQTVIQDRTQRKQSIEDTFTEWIIWESGTNEVRDVIWKFMMITNSLKQVTTKNKSTIIQFNLKI